MDVRDHGTDSVSDVKGLDVLQVSDWDTFEEAYWWLVANPNKYKTLIIDTMSQLQQVVVEDVLASKKKDTNKAGGWGVMTRQEWGEVSSRLKTRIIQLRDLPLEVVFIAQDRVFNMDDEDGDSSLDPEVGPQLSPSVAKCLNAAVHVIGNTFVRRREEKNKVKVKGKSKIVTKEYIEYGLRLGPNPTYVTKVRKPKNIIPPSVLVDPTYAEIMKLVKGE